MLPYNQERIDNAICFFASEFKKKTRRNLNQTYLYKFLAFFDFFGQERFGIPPLNLVYRAMQRGPVPIELYSNRFDLNTPLYYFDLVDKDKSIIEIIAKKKSVLSFFSKMEINLMNELIEIYADKFVKSKIISEASHESIKAWKRTWLTKQNAIIDYDLTFDDNIFEKQEDKLTTKEESYIIFKSLQTI